ncbi:MAG TPA: type I methionyl aminopeptidase [Haliscomenobacter sp.]|jgi:methionyl aminopeptidase|uniref:type I methionyl aminopeptidase n=1 Tax=Haliscomenobacter sp. TaxID=2717303 RepID=UPI001DE6A007|nr:type I methionyl aminopeptidase [Haliscomenobacter sp.]MBK9491495.1 type I methionyl aminopeptidase [Haliscomenobacter sp.]HOY18303.1 type I methionyl aminopeptidase [Haliscomenobacter sp.]
MVYYKTDEEVEFIRKSCLLVCDALAHVASIIRPGITAKEIDAAAETVILDHGALPAFKGYRGFPATLCVSINEQVVHGIPTGNVIFQDGDIVSVDCGVQWNGFFGDAAYTFPLGNVSEKVMELCRVTKTSLYKGIEQAVAGHRIGDVSFAIQNYVEKGFQYGIVRELVGHGVGRNLHEDPEVPNYGKRGKGIKLQEGLVIAIEPMVNLGKKEVITAKDGWTVAAKDHQPSAHYEHTVVVRRNKADILSNHVPIETAISKNSEVREVSLKGEMALEMA